MFGLPSIMRARKPRQYSYEPRYYDEVKERIKEREEALKKEMNLDDSEDDGLRRASRMRAAFRHESAIKNTRKQGGVNRSLVQVLIALVLTATFAAYIYFGAIGLLLLIVIYILYKIAQNRGIR